MGLCFSFRVQDLSWGLGAGWWFKERVWSSYWSISWSALLRMSLTGAAKKSPSIFIVIWDSSQYFLFEKSSFGVSTNGGGLLRKFKSPSSDIHPLPTLSPPTIDRCSLYFVYIGSLCMLFGEDQWPKIFPDRLQTWQDDQVGTLRQHTAVLQDA